MSNIEKLFPVAGFPSFLSCPLLCFVVVFVFCFFNKR